MEIFFKSYVIYDATLELINGIVFVTHLKEKERTSSYVGVRDVQWRQHTSHNVMYQYATFSVIIN